MAHLTTETYISDIKQPFNLIQKMLEDLTENEIALNDFIEGVDVVVINTQRRFEELDFDVVIIDEVGQILGVEKDLVENRLFYAFPESHKVLLDT